ncbi:thioredoxin domain-containing protein [Roseisolibacter sp. H3M3-2]|uniref:DsbA family protein n=1 Tax=Roseisolibacter sp. H3M3-2 TaxID=3031323 RepID=UPI0023DB5BA2|nr:thioredoxin domain-containing protein [Roseisolibacter sp. H3M3-2]MDF1502693.1 thioredoxin domain-containing protein [Roseisolibacter sp. H3M3-2]
MSGALAIPTESPRPAAADARDGARHASPSPRPGDPAVGRVTGSLDAPATLVVYGTYECLDCRRTWPALRALAESGRARVEWRHYAPPGAFPNAGRAAAAAEAAGAQGKFWAMHEAMMDAPAPLWPESLAAIAVALGLDVVRFARDLESAHVRARLEAQEAAARADAVRGTPTILGDVELLRHG